MTELNSSTKFKSNHVKWITLAVWVIFGIIALAITVQLVISLRLKSPFPNLFVPIFTVLDGMIVLAFAFLGVLIVTRLPQNVIGWLLILPGLLGSIPGENYIRSFSSAPSQPTVLLILALWFTYWNWLLVVIPILFIPALFPTGRPLSPRWRWLIVAGLALAAYFFLIASFQLRFAPVNIDPPMDWSIANPIGFIPDDFADTLIGPFVVGFISVTILSFASIFVRYRRAGLVERQQIKWLLYACALFATAYIAGSMISDLQGLMSDIRKTLSNLTFLAVPAAIAIAILRYHLWDIELIIRRTLQYSLLTGLLALVYFGSVVLGQRLAGALTGPGESPLVVVVSTLLIAALFNPLRRRVQAFIDRRFYRQKYDAIQTLAAFTQAARDETRLDALVPALLQVVQESMQPEQAWLWLRMPQTRSDTTRLISLRHKPGSDYPGSP
jgi:hypothetical protein